MKINKQQLSALSALPDEALWREIVRMGAEHGIKIPADPPSHEELMRLRGIIADPDKLRMSDAIRAVNDYKKKYMK